MASETHQEWMDRLGIPRPWQDAVMTPQVVNRLLSWRDEDGVFHGQHPVADGLRGEGYERYFVMYLAIQAALQLGLLVDEDNDVVTRTGMVVGDAISNPARWAFLTGVPHEDHVRAWVPIQAMLVDQEETPEIRVVRRAANRALALLKRSRHPAVAGSVLRSKPKTAKAKAKAKTKTKPVAKSKAVKASRSKKK